MFHIHCIFFSRKPYIQLRIKSTISNKIKKDNPRYYANFINNLYKFYLEHATTECQIKTGYVVCICF